jgi:DNA-binding response OmpR family regulator
MQKILVVDDDTDLLFSVERVLQKNHYQVVALSDCTAAAATALEHQPHLMLLDVNMGICDGRELCRELKNSHHFSIPILLFSANGEYAADASNYNADGFIQKPFDSAEFVEFIRKYLLEVSE